MAAAPRLLPGLPPYGPSAVSFSSSGYGAHREGVVIEFESVDGHRWVGNFQRGGTTFDAVLTTFAIDRPVIVAGGRAYLLDATSRTVIAEFGDYVIWAVEWRDTIVLADELRFEALNRNGVVWRSERVSWDGMRDLSLDGSFVRGFAFSPIDNDYYRFVLDLETGSFTGGSYNGPK